MSSTSIRRYYRLSLSTLIAVYFLILVGGIVRSTGSGMGCPDWPRCFGSWVPPVSVSELPTDYREKSAAFRAAKNEKFARYLRLIGLKETADKILKDKSILAESEFNATKTWVEYINRLVGVTIGLMIIALFVVSWRTRRMAPELFRGSMLLLLLVIFQGWFGSIVVSTNLTPWTVTIHLFLAVLMVALLVWLNNRSGVSRAVPESGLKYWLLAGLAALSVQIFLGTRVRQVLDVLAVTLSREAWINNAGADFVVHRSFSWMVILIQVGIWLKLRKTTAEKSTTLIAFLLILLSVLTGSAMALFGVPPYLQPVHLLLAIVTFGCLFQVFLQTNRQHGEIGIKI